MGWKVGFDPRALRKLDKLDRLAQRRILKFLQGRVVERTDPRELGKALTGEQAGFWRYRIGDYRAVCFLDDKSQVAKVMRVAHRKEVHR